MIDDSYVLKEILTISFKILANFTYSVNSLNYRTFEINRAKGIYVHKKLVILIQDIQKYKAAIEYVSECQAVSALVEAMTVISNTVAKYQDQIVDSLFGFQEALL